MILRHRTALWLAASTLIASLGAAAAAPHPLDPLSAPEIGAVRQEVLGDSHLFYELLGQSEEWNKALARRKIDPRDVKADFWVYGTSDRPRPRTFRAVPYFQGSGTNYYSRPIEGLEALVDLVNRKVEVIDRWDGEPVPPESPEFTEDWIRDDEHAGAAPDGRGRQGPGQHLEMGRRDLDQAGAGRPSPRSLHRCSVWPAENTVT